MATRTGIRISGFPVEVTETADALTLESEGSRDLVLDAGSGKVGIGTTDPAVALDVIGTASFAGAEASLSQGNVQVGVDSGGDPGGELMFHTDDYVGLRCADSGALSLAVKPSGNVGIGTTAPAVALDVIGTGSFAGAEASLSQGNVQVGVDSGGDPGGELMFHTDDYVGLRCADSGALPFAVKPSGNVGIGDVAPGTQLQVSGTAPYVTLKNSTAENTAGGCESKIIFEDHADVTLAQVEGSHSGSSDDTKGKLILSTHTGSALTAALTIDDAQDATFSGDVVVTGELDVSGGALAFGNGQNAALDVDAVSGTNTAGKSLTISGGQSTGSGAGGDIVFKASNQGSSGSSANALTTVAVMKAPDDDSFVNFLEFMGSPAGQGCGVEVSGDSSSTNVDLNLNSKGTDSYVRIESKEISNFTDAVAKGAGVGNAAAVDVTIAHHNCEIVTTICVDIQGLVSTGTIKRVLSDSGETTAAYLTQLTAAKNGIIYKAEMACVEQPAVASGTLVADIDLVTSDVATLGGGEDYDSGGDDIVLVTSGGDWDTGRCVYSASAADLDPEDFYLYLACGNATSANTAAYSAGKFIIKLYGASF